MKMLLVNTDSVPNYEITEVLGIVRGNTVRAKNIGRDIFASFKNLVGGEISGYTELLTEARDEAVNRMKSEAAGFNADAILNVRFTTSAVSQGMSEILVYGTAVKLKPKE